MTTAQLQALAATLHTTLTTIRQYMIVLPEGMVDARELRRLHHEVQTQYATVMRAINAQIYPIPAGWTQHSLLGE